MPYRDLSEDRHAMRRVAGHSDGELPSYGGPSRPGLWAFLVWLFSTGACRKRK